LALNFNLRPYTKAAEYFTRAAERGNSTSQLNLGSLYQKAGKRKLKLVLKVPGCMQLMKLEYEKLVSIFAFDCKLRPYRAGVLGRAYTRSLSSSP
jgi:TPR repeat protein